MKANVARFLGYRKAGWMFALLLGTPWMVLPAFGDDVTKLPADTPTAIKQSTALMTAAGVDRKTAVALTRKMLDYGMSADSTSSAQMVIVAAQKEGLPVQPIIDKIHEGIAKRAHERNIVIAAGHTRNRYKTAFKFAKAISNNKKKIKEHANIIADGLTAGLEEIDLEIMNHYLKQRARKQKNRSIDALATETYKTARDMSRLGVESRIVGTAVTRAIDQGYNTKEMQRMRKSFVSRSQSTSPNKLAEKVADRLQSGSHSGGRGGGHSVEKGGGNIGQGGGKGGGQGSGKGGGKGGSKGGSKGNSKGGGKGSGKGGGNSKNK